MFLQSVLVPVTFMGVQYLKRSAAVSYKKQRVIVFFPPGKLSKYPDKSETSRIQQLSIIKVNLYTLTRPYPRTDDPQYAFDLPP